MSTTQQLCADTLENTRSWLPELLQIGGLESQQQAHSVLHAALPPLRDGLKPAKAPERIRSCVDFLEQVSSRLRNCPVDPEVASRSVFELLERRVTEAQIEDVKHLMNNRLRDLWGPEEG